MRRDASLAVPLLLAFVLVSGFGDSLPGPLSQPVAAAATPAVVGTQPPPQAAGNTPPANVLSPPESGEGWKLLFDGKSLSGWEKTGEADWIAKDGVVTFSTGRGMLVSSQSFANFALKVDFLGEKTANSGVFLRCPAASTGLAISQTSCYEVNIFDPHETAPTGSVVGIQSVLPDRPDTADKWNTFEILAEGSHLVVKLNGKTTVDTRDDKLKLVNGAIALQAGGPGGPGIIRFRNIKIRSL